MDFNRSFVGFLEGKLFCFRFTDNNIVFGVFRGLSEDNIIIEKPCDGSDGRVSQRIPCKKDAIAGITSCDDLLIAHVLNVGIKASQKVKKALKERIN